MTVYFRHDAKDDPRNAGLLEYFKKIVNPKEEVVEWMKEVFKTKKRAEPTWLAYRLRADPVVEEVSVLGEGKENSRPGGGSIGNVVRDATGKFLSKKDLGKLAGTPVEEKAKDS